MAQRMTGRGRNRRELKVAKVVAVLDAPDGSLPTVIVNNQKIPSTVFADLNTLTPEIVSKVADVRAQGADSRMTVAVVAGKVGVSGPALSRWLANGNDVAERLAEGAECSLTPHEVLCMQLAQAWAEGNAQRRVGIEEKITEGALESPEFALKVIQQEERADDRASNKDVEQGAVINVLAGAGAALVALARRSIAEAPQAPERVLDI